MQLQEDKLYYYRRGNQELLIFGALEQFIDNKKIVMVYITTLGRNLIITGDIEEESEEHMLFQTTRGSVLLTYMKEKYFDILKKGMGFEVFKGITWKELKSEGILDFTV